MGVALVGGTFATWAVTDNADPFSIQVSTGSVSPAETQYLTLEWGESRSMSNVSNLAIDTVRKVGVLDLRANTLVTGYDSYEGELKLSIAGGEHIAAALQVKVFEGDIAPAYDAEHGTYTVGKKVTVNGQIFVCKTAVAEPEVFTPAKWDALTPADSMAGALTFNAGVCEVEVDLNAANLFTVMCFLPDGTDAGDIALMEGESANLTFNWDKNSEDSSTVKYYATGFNKQTYIYAWNDQGQQLHAWPGVEMTQIGESDYYEIDLDTQFTNIIFNDNDGKQTDTLVRATTFSDGKNLFTFDGVDSGTASVVNPSYYLKGSFNSWSDDTGTIALTADPAIAGKYSSTTVHFDANTELKAYVAPFGVYFTDAFSWDEELFVVLEGGNIKIIAAGDYTVDFYLTDSTGQGNHVVINKVSA